MHVLLTRNSKCNKFEHFFHFYIEMTVSNNLSKILIR